MATYWTAEQITNLYLYGQENGPADLTDSNLIRSDEARIAPLEQDIVSYMTTGPGRFAIGSQFALVRDFFEPDFFGMPAPVIPPGTYTQRSLAAQLGVDVEGNFSYLLIFHERDFADATPDYAERTYIWNSVAFQIDDSARFIVDADGTKHIENFVILPYLNNGKMENFDFNSTDTIAALGGLSLQPDLDPSKIGRTVNFAFTGVISPKSYTSANYEQDKLLATTWDHPGLSTLLDAIRGLEDKLFSESVAPALVGNQPVIYGTTGNDSLSWLLLNDHKYLGDDIANGIIFVAGSGADDITTSDYDDTLIGGSGADTFFARSGNEFLDGGDLSIDRIGGFVADSGEVHIFNEI